MSAYSRDNSIYGHYLLPLALVAKEPENPMQHIEDLRNDLKFAEDQNTPSNLSAVITSQETVRAVLADLLTIRTRAERAEGAIKDCIDYANGRETEWGSRAEGAFEYLYAALAPQPAQDGGEVR